MLRLRKPLAVLMILVLFLGASMASGCFPKSKKEAGKKVSDAKAAIEKGARKVKRGVDEFNRGAREFKEGYCEGEKEKGKKGWLCQD